MQVVERARLCTRLQITEALGLPCEKLRLVFDREALVFHLHEILAAEFSVVPDSADLKAGGAQLFVPAHHVVIVRDGVVGHIQPAVLLPAE